MAESNFDVLVIGAGAAGLAAAHDLSGAGLKVCVIEARNRIGGRIFTYRSESLPLPIELGAEFIHGKSPELFELVEESNLLLCDSTERHWYLHNGVLAKTNEFWDKLNQLMDAMKRERTDRSFKDFLNSLSNDEETREAKAIARRYVEGFHAAQTDRIGIHGLNKVNDAADSIGNKQFRTVTGYESLMDWLPKQSIERGTVFHLATAVIEIVRNNRGIEATCEREGQTEIFEAECAVITLPLGVLQCADNRRGAVRFNPELPEKKRAAIKQLAMGHALKVNLVFYDRFWEELELPHDGKKERLDEIGFIHSSDVLVPTWWTQLPLRVPLLVGWVGGPKAEVLGRSNDDAILDVALHSLAQILSVSQEFLRERLRDHYFHNWHSDPLSQGSYSYLPVDGIEAQKELARPVDDLLFFAGEATSVEGHIGTVHGALISGQRAAREILKTRN